MRFEAIGIDPAAGTNGDGPKQQKHRGRRVELTPARAVRSERMRWLWQGRFPLRGLSVVAGEKGLGKSILTNALLPALLTRGVLEGDLYGQPVDVLVASAEDDWRTVVKPRLMAHGASLDRVHRVAVMDDESEGLLTLPDDVARLEAVIREKRKQAHDVKALVVDPIGAFLSPSTDTHRDASVRRALAPLATMAERTDVSVAVVMHLTKDESTRLINRVTGNAAFVNAARFVLSFARHPDDSQGEQGSERIIAHVACNWGRYAPSLAGRVESRRVDLDDGSTGETAHLRITGETDVGVEDLQRGADGTATDVEELIGAALKDGPRAAPDVKAEVAKQLDCSKRTVERAADRMEQRGELVKESGGWPRRTLWTLAPPHSGDSGEGGHSSDTSGPSSDTSGPSSDTRRVATAVATNPNTRRVATDSSDDATGKNHFPGDPVATVATRSLQTPRCAVFDHDDDEPLTNPQENA